LLHRYVNFANLLVGLQVAVRFDEVARVNVIENLLLSLGPPFWVAKHFTERVSTNGQTRLECSPREAVKKNREHDESDQYISTIALHGEGHDGKHNASNGGCDQQKKS
jgi:hypothetical protein